MKNEKRNLQWREFKRFRTESDAKRQSNRLAIICGYATKVEYNPLDKCYILLILSNIEIIKINKELTSFG